MVGSEDVRDSLRRGLGQSLVSKLLFLNRDNTPLIPGNNHEKFSSPGVTRIIFNILNSLQI